MVRKIASHRDIAPYRSLCTARMKTSCIAMSSANLSTARPPQDADDSVREEASFVIFPLFAAMQMRLVPKAASPALTAEYSRALVADDKDEERNLAWRQLGEIMRDADQTLPEYISADFDSELQFWNQLAIARHFGLPLAEVRAMSLWEFLTARKLWSQGL